MWLFVCLFYIYLFIYFFYVIIIYFIIFLLFVILLVFSIYRWTGFYQNSRPYFSSLYYTVVALMVLLFTHICIIYKYC